MTHPLVTVEGLTFRFPGTAVPVLENLSVSIARGERVAVLGPNGSGKTTFALHLDGLLALQTGRIALNGKTLNGKILDGEARNGRASNDESVTAIRREVGMVFQDPDDQLFMTSVHDDVAFGPANLGLRDTALADRVHTTLADVGATELASRSPHHLSGGEKRRVALATALAMRPELLVLDEPTSGLDPAGSRELAELLGSLDTTQVIVTHDLPFALATCTRALILAQGNFVADGPIRDVLGDTALLAAHRLEFPFGYPALP